MRGFINLTLWLSRALTRRLTQLGFACLDATTRTWPAFWGTASMILFYCWWNSSKQTRDHFDPYPFALLTVMIGASSYLQNIIIMTLQREQDRQFDVIKAKQQQQDEHMLHLMETATAQGQVIIGQGSLDEQRIKEMMMKMARVEILLARLEGD